MFDKIVIELKNFVAGLQEKIEKLQNRNIELSQRIYEQGQELTKLRQIIADHEESSLVLQERNTTLSQRIILDWTKKFDTLTKSFENLRKERDKLISENTLRSEQLLDRNLDYRDLKHKCEKLERDNKMLLENIERKEKELADRWRENISQENNNDFYRREIKRLKEQLQTPQAEAKRLLISQLQGCKTFSEENDTEVAHMNADKALLDYIGDEDVNRAFAEIHKWYS